MKVRALLTHLIMKLNRLPTSVPLEPKPIEQISVFHAKPIISALRENFVYFAIRRLGELEGQASKIGSKLPFEGLETLREAVQEAVDRCLEDNERVTAEAIKANFSKYVSIR